jgi:hypothetical protein
MCTLGGHIYTRGEPRTDLINAGVLISIGGNLKTGLYTLLSARVVFYMYMRAAYLDDSSGWCARTDYSCPGLGTENKLGLMGGMALRFGIYSDE